MSKGKELAIEFVREKRNGAEDTRAFFNPLMACMQHVAKMTNERGAKTNGALISVVDEAINIWKCFARETNKLMSESYVSEDGFLRYIKKNQPEMYDLYEIIHSEKDFLRKEGQS